MELLAEDFDFDHIVRQIRFTSDDNFLVMDEGGNLRYYEFKENHLNLVTKH